MANDQITAAETDAERYLRETLSTTGRNPSGSLVERMGVRFHAVSPERLVATMPVVGNTQPYGLLHGGASVVLAESLGSVGAALHAAPDRVAAGLEVGATHHRSVTSGEVTGTATAIQLGRSVATYEVVITDEADRRVCTARITCLIRSTKPTNQSPSPNGDARRSPELVPQSTTQPDKSGRFSASDAVALLLRGGTVRIAAPTAALVGSVLSAVNQGAVIATGHATGETWLRVAINYVVPFIVASVGALSVRRSRA